MSEWEKKLDITLNSIRELLLKKHHDYGEENLLEFGELGILIRVSDKVARLKHIQKTCLLTSETNVDTWMDLAGYAIQALIMNTVIMEKTGHDSYSESNANS